MMNHQPVVPAILPVVPAFVEGDEVVLASGTYQGTLGVFLRLDADVHWAEIAERNGGIRSHPVEWLALSTSSTPGNAKGKAI